MYIEMLMMSGYAVLVHCVQAGYLLFQVKYYYSNEMKGHRSELKESTLSWLWTHLNTLLKWCFSKMIYGATLRKVYKSNYKITFKYVAVLLKLKILLS